MNLRQEARKIEDALDAMARRLADPSRPSPLPTPEEIRERMNLQERAEALAVAAMLLGEGTK